MTERAFLSISEVAAQLGVSTDTARRYLESGVLRGYRFTSKSPWKVRQEELDRFLAAAQQTEGSVA